MDQLLRVNIKNIEELHGASIFQDPRYLRSRRNELEHVTIVLDGPRTMLGSMAHLQGIFQHSNQLLDLTIVQSVPRNAPPGGQPLEKKDPFIPLPVRGDLDGPLVLLQGNGESVSCKEIKSTLGQTVIDMVEDAVLFCGIKISRELGQLLLPDGKISRRGWIQDLVRAIKFIPVG